ncbi:DNA-directed RNA polymerase III subunit RPC7 [Pseudochaenichthys georgianus]|uniref:DNA-directed RNA polymerase III subunit RPC7 n=1 Tax=Pseudochaenichthys georgianus TaxID=52239 RepID=UPI00146EA630|nr:DNA-directed RNA polymerase III subunit RPC7 [Pseudochaenichthys georgianus]
MAGKGRGVGAFTFNIEALGIGRGSMPDSRVGPMPLFPNIDFKPVPLKAGEEEDYMLALKQEMRGTMQRLPHNIKCHANKAEVERYTERYLKQSQLDDANWTPDWSLLPKELMPQKKKVVKPVKQKKAVKISRKETEAMLTKLDELEKKDDGNPEKSDDETEKKKVNEGEEEEEIEAEEYDEEDVEEENDYIDSYFDNGEDFGGAGSDENVDGEGTY